MAGLATKSGDISLLQFESGLAFGFVLAISIWFCIWLVARESTIGTKGGGVASGASNSDSALAFRLVDTSTAVNLLVAIGCAIVLATMCAAMFGLSTHFGVEALVCVLAVAWTTDTGAYFTGRTIGQRPLAKRISPKKTVEGTVGGGLAGFALVALLGFIWFKPQAGWSTGLILGLAFLLPALAITGDLIESALKRVAGQKESGSILPGHGGLLDRFDSLIYAAPAMMAFLMFSAAPTE